MINRSHVGVYAIVVRANTLLLVAKTRGPYKGKYDLPGGRMEPGESSLQALSRELLEETGAIANDIALWDICSCTVEYEDNGENVSFNHVGALYSVTLKTEPNRDLMDRNEDVSRFDWYAIESLSRGKVTPFVWHFIQTWANPDKLD